MKKFTKSLALALTAILFVSGLAACDTGGDTPETGAQSTPEATTSEETDNAEEETIMTNEEGYEVNADGALVNPEEVEVDENKLVFWSMFSGGDGTFMDQMVEDYNGTNPTKQVQSLMVVWGEYYTKLMTGVASNNGPDLGVTHISKLPELVEQRVVIGLNEHAEEADVNWSNYTDAMNASITFDDDRYAVPLDTHAEILYYNLDHLEEAGIELNSEGSLDISSAEEFEALLEKAKPVLDDGQTTISFPPTGDDPYRIWWAVYFQMDGPALFNEDSTEVTLDKEIAVEAAKYVKSLYDDGYILEGISDHQRLFQGGDAAFMFGGTWATGAFEQTENLEFGAQPMPQLFNNEAGWADAHNIILPVNNDRDEADTVAAMKFAAYVSGDGASTWAGSGQIPSNTTVLESDEYKNMPYRSSYALAGENAVLPSSNPNFYGAKEEMIDALNLIWLGQVEAEEGIDQLHRGLEANRN